MAFGSNRRNHNPDEVRFAEQDALRQIGFSDVQQLEGGAVFGIRNHIVVMIGHFTANGGGLHEIVMAAGDSGTSDPTNATRDEVLNKVRSIQFFD